MSKYVKLIAVVAVLLVGSMFMPAQAFGWSMERTTGTGDDGPAGSDDGWPRPGCGRQ